MHPTGLTLRVQRLLSRGHRLSGRKRRSSHPGRRVMLPVGGQDIQKGDCDEKRRAAPETKGVTVKLLAALDLGPEIEGMAGHNFECVW